jgi:hypothetical protein
VGASDLGRSCGAGVVAFEQHRCGRIDPIGSEAEAEGAREVGHRVPGPWRYTLGEAGYPSVSEIGDAENISKSYVSRILCLALLAPDIVEAILAGRAHGVLVLDRLEQPPPASWEEQRDLFGFSD